jgi:hypothetical protein
MHAMAAFFANSKVAAECKYNILIFARPTDTAAGVDGGCAHQFIRFPILDAADQDRATESGISDNMTPVIIVNMRVPRLQLSLVDQQTGCK